MNKRGQRRITLSLLVILTIIIIIVVGLMWIGYGKFTPSGTNKKISVSEMNTTTKLIFTLVGLALLLFGWGNYARQKRIDQGVYQPSTLGDKAISTYYKVTGWTLVWKGIMTCLTSLILFGVSIAIFAGFLIDDPSGIYLGILILLISIGLFVYGLISFFRSKALIKGRYY